MCIPRPALRRPAPRGMATALAALAASLLFAGFAAAQLAPAGSAGGAPGPTSAQVVLPLPGAGPLLSPIAQPVAPLWVVRDDRWGTVRRLEGRLPGPASTADADVVARLRALGPLLSVEEADDGWRVAEVVSDALGMTHVRALRTYRGLDVVGSELVLHLDPRGDIVAMGGTYHPDLVLDAAEPVLRPAEALARGRALLGAPDAPVVTAPRLVVGVREGDEEPRLAWEMTLGPVARPRRPVDVWRVFVDAADGSRVKALLLTWSADAQPVTLNATHELGQNVALDAAWFPDEGLYALVSLSRPGGQFATANAQGTEQSGSPFASRDGVFTDARAVSVHHHLQRIYDYYSTVHQRRSWDGNGAGVFGQVHVSRNLANAFWYAGQLWFGDGNVAEGLSTTTACFDITAHEFTHGVVDGTVQLEYQYQSGALNEHFADWGAAMMDSEDPWRMATRCTTGQPIRDFANPANALMPLPGNMSGYQDLPNTEAGDNGGVHINVGIPNRALYLAAQNVGRDRVEQIWYRVLNARLITSRAGFADFVQAVFRAADELYPGDSAVRDGLSRAFADVGLAAGAGGGECPPNAHAQGGFCYCDAGYSPDAAGTGCAAQTADCPPHAYAQAGYCYCETGYGVSEDGSQCVPLEQGGCPPDSHLEGALCACDHGYVGSPYNGGCQPSASGGCPPNSAPGGDGTCYCVQGYVVDDLDVACIPTAGGCGDETFYGRCAGNVLVYCDDLTDPGNPTLVVGDCGATDRTCYLADTEIGFLCGDGAGTTGGCPPNAELGADGNCYCGFGYTPNGSACVAIDGSDGGPGGCPPNAHGEADGNCHCDDGFAPDSAGTLCVAASGGGGGCATAPRSGPTPWPLALLALFGALGFAVRRRSRASDGGIPGSPSRR